MGWINGNFGKDLAFQTIWSLDPTASGWGQFQLAHGYVLVEGQVRGLTAGQIRAARQGPYPSGYEARLVDKDGREYWFTGHAIAQHPWACYSNSLAVFTTARWNHRGREGFGLAQENWPLDLLTGRGPARAATSAIS